MFNQFIGREYWITLAVLATTFLVAVLVFADPALSALALAYFFLAALSVSWVRPDIGIMIAFAELFANSHGHLISYAVDGFSVSLRMAVFAAVMAAWAVSVLSGRVRMEFRDSRLVWFVPLAAAVLVGFGIGFAQNNPVDAFKDGNAYLYLAYAFPILTVQWDGRAKRALFQVLAASATWVVALTLGLLYVFTHFPEWMLGPTYQFIRDTRTGELTKMAGNIFRVFLQAQLSAVAGLFVLAPLLFLRDPSRRDLRILLVLLAGLLSGVLVSLSRSFWVGMIVGAPVLLALVWLDTRPAARVLARGIGLAAMAAVLAVTFLVGIVLFPLPYRVGRVGDLTGLFSDRTTDLSDVAISSRWNLLPPLVEEIRSAPLLGKGFGEEVTFKTDDPRARAINPDGTWTTYSLEWGWLELWLKMGILGPVSFAILLGGLVRGLWPYLRSEQSWIGISLVSMLVTLYVTHVFSPYLNHPLGLGLLLFAVPFLKRNSPAGEPETIIARVSVTPAVVQASVAPSIAK